MNGQVASHGGQQQVHTMPQPSRACVPPMTAATLGMQGAQMWQARNPHSGCWLRAAMGQDSACCASAPPAIPGCHALART